MDKLKKKNMEDGMGMMLHCKHSSTEKREGRSLQPDVPVGLEKTGEVFIPI